MFLMPNFLLVSYHSGSLTKHWFFFPFWRPLTISIELLHRDRSVHEEVNSEHIHPGATGKAKLDIISRNSNT